MKQLQSITGILLDEIARQYPKRKYAPHPILKIQSFQDVQMVTIYEQNSFATFGVTCNGSWIHVLLFTEEVSFITKESKIATVFAVKANSSGEIFSYKLYGFHTGHIQISTFSPALFSLFMKIQKKLYEKSIHALVLN